MKVKEIGQTGVQVSELALGCSSIGNLYREISEATSNEVLNLAWKGGVRYFDTAPHYGRGLSEARLGRFLSRKHRDDFVVSSKVGRVLFPGTQQSEADGFINPLPNYVRYDYSGNGIEDSFEQSCERLQTNHIDILYVHDIGTYTHGMNNKKHMAAFMETGIDRLNKLKKKGRIRAFGLGVNENQICIDILKEAALDVILLAGRLTLLDRSAEEELVPLCSNSGTSLVLGGIFNSGILATGPVKGASYDYGPAPDEVLGRVSLLQQKATGLGMPLATAALKFACNYPLAASVLIGTAKPTSLIRNLEALQAKWTVAAHQTFAIV